VRKKYFINYKKYKKMKKLLTRLQKYMGKRKMLLPGSLLSSAISAVL
jgi:hypothetical protein